MLKKLFNMFENDQPIRIYLSGELKSPENYFQIIDTIRMAGQGKKINVYLNGPGGAASTAIQFINAYQECKGSIVSWLDGEAYSAHAILLLASPTIVIGNHTRFMAHHAGFGSFGRGMEVVDYAKNTEEWLYALVDEYFGKILTPSELELMKAGKDYYFNKDELVRRLHGWGWGTQMNDGSWTFTRWDRLNVTPEQVQEYLLPLLQQDKEFYTQLFRVEQTKEENK